MKKEKLTKKEFNAKKHGKAHKTLLKNKGIKVSPKTIANS